jgi:hypothetical protein
MQDTPIEREPDAKESDPNVARRRFLMGAAAGAGVLSAIGALGERVGAAGSQAAQGGNIPPDMQADIQDRTRTAEELPRPVGLRTNSMLDARFPVYYRASVGEAMKLLTEYFALFSARDLAGVANTMHFPYATYEGVEPIVYKTTAEFIANPPPSLNVTNNDKGNPFPGTYKMVTRPGTYDILDNLQLHTYNPINVGLELCYTRYRADGHKIGISQGIYAVTNNDGKWGLQLSSMIFTPSDFVGVTYNDATEALLRQHRTGYADLSYHDVDMIRLRGLAGVAGPPPGSKRPQTTRRSASIMGDAGAVSYLDAARAGVPMEPYNTRGVKSRLRVTDPENPANNFSGGPDNRITSNIWVTPEGGFGPFYELAGEGAVTYSYTFVLPDMRVLHAAPDKAHTVTGYVRFTPEHDVISETRSLGIMVYDTRNERWENSGGYGQMTRHDCTNDVGS